MDFLAKIDYISLAPAQLHLQFKLSLSTYLSSEEKPSQRHNVERPTKFVFNVGVNIPLKRAKRLIGRLYCLSNKDLQGSYKYGQCYILIADNIF